MPLLGFERRFMEAIENGVAAAHRRRAPHPKHTAKRQTIRAQRADGRDPRPGDTLYLYVGLRTQQVRKLGEVECRSVERLRIAVGGLRVHSGTERLDRARLRRLARANGFDSTGDFVAFFERRHGLPFDGYLLRW